MKPNLDLDPPFDDQPDDHFLADERKDIDHVRLGSCSSFRNIYISAVIPCPATHLARPNDTTTHRRIDFDIMSDPVFSASALANSTLTDQILTIALKGKEVRTLAPIFAPLPINALLLGILTWQVGRYWMVYGKTDSVMTRGLVAALMVLSMGTTAAVCSESPAGLSSPSLAYRFSGSSVDVQRIHQVPRALVRHVPIALHRSALRIRRISVCLDFGEFARPLYSSYRRHTIADRVTLMITSADLVRAQGLASLQQRLVGSYRHHVLLRHRRVSRHRDHGKSSIS